MADGSSHPSIFRQSYLASQLSPNLHSRISNVHNLSGAAYVNGGLQNPVFSAFQANGLAALSAPMSPVLVQALAEKGVAGFMIDFLMGGVSAAVSKTVGRSSH